MPGTMVPGIRIVNHLNYTRKSLWFRCFRCSDPYCITPKFLFVPVEKKTPVKTGLFNCLKSRAPWVRFNKQGWGRYSYHLNTRHLNAGHFGCPVFKWLGKVTCTLIWIPGIFDHNQAFSSPFSDHHSNTGPFDNPTQIYHSNTGLVW